MLLLRPVAAASSLWRMKLKERVALGILASLTGQLYLNEDRDDDFQRDKSFDLIVKKLWTLASLLLIDFSVTSGHFHLDDDDRDLLTEKVTRSLIW